jgi:hypothetical protein
MAAQKSGIRRPKAESAAPAKKARFRSGPLNRTGEAHDQ